MHRNKIESRTVEVDDIELRALDGGGEQRYVEGLGVVYGREVELWPGYYEKINPAAFTRHLDGEEIKSYFNHDSAAVLSTTKSKPPLELYNTAEGLRFRSPIPPTSYGNDLIVNLERRNVRGASFAFVVVEDVITIDENREYHREVMEAFIYEVGPVTNPAYPQAKVGVRSRDEMFNEAETRCKAKAEPRGKNKTDIHRKRLNLIKGR